MSMNLTRGADYAVRVALHLAMLPDDARASRGELARLAEASPTFVAKILQQLAAADIVRSRPGSRGGFELARPRDEISVLDIVTAIDGQVCLNKCVPQAEGCHRAVWCPVHPVWAHAQHAIVQILGGTSLAQLAGIDPLPAVARADVPAPLRRAAGGAS